MTSWNEMLDAVVIEPKEAHQYSLIWLHGLGADGHDFSGLMSELQIPALSHTRCIFPHAPVRPITLNGGYPMRGWYDIKSLDRATFQHDQAGIEQSAELINKLIQAELERGIPYRNMVLAGFSQGGAMALVLGLQNARPLGGVLALSTYVPGYPGFERSLTSESRGTPIAFYHGTQDHIIPLETAKASIQFLVEQGYAVEQKFYEMDHTLCSEELLDIRAFLMKALYSVEG
jgi:phospholipase/carboxylesterase